MSGLAFILYRSETEMRPNSDAARQLLDTARSVNEQRNLSGFLHHEDGFFFQWLEGEPEPVAEIGERIERDPRHSHLTYLWRGTQDTRQFASWRMGYSTTNDASILLWLANHPVASRERRAYAGAVLSFLQAREMATR